MPKRRRHMTRIAFLATGVVLLLAANGRLGAEGLRIENSDTITDEAGRRVRIAQPFRRIISLYGAHTENLLALGLDDQLVGVESGAGHPNKPAGKTEFSYHDDPEKFLAFHPDLVLIRPMIDRGYPQLVQRLSDHGIAVVSLQPGTVEEMYAYWQILGMLTGREQAALDMTAAFKTAVADFRSLTKDIASKKRVYFEAIHDKMKTFTPDSMAIFALQTAGGINIAADAGAVRGTNIAYYGKERILAKAPEIDVYLAQAGPMNQPTVAMIETEPGYAIIAAVRQKEIYIIDEQIVSRPTPRLLIGIETIGKALYPDVFTADKTAKITAAAAGSGGRH